MKKASDFSKTMQNAFSESNWHSTGLEAVHCAISAADALLAKEKGIKCTSNSHMDVVELLLQTLGTKENTEHFKALEKKIKYKNGVEYQDRLFTQQEAADIKKRSERFYEWAVKQTDYKQ
jgi:hypothetical protein